MGDDRRRFLGAPDLVTREVLDETLVVPIRAGAADLQALYVLNPTGAYLWRQLDGQRTATELAEALCARFDVDSQAARQDVEDFLASLEEAGLAADVSASGGSK